MAIFSTRQTRAPSVQPESIDVLLVSSSDQPYPWSWSAKSENHLNLTKGSSQAIKVESFFKQFSKGYFQMETGRLSR